MQTSKLAEYLEHIVKEGKPFLLTRIGDGESYFLSRSMEKMQFVCKRQYGYVPFSHHFDYIRYLLIESYISSDIIGVPTKAHLELNSGWKNAERLMRENVHNHKKKLYCSINSHLEMLDQKLYGWLPKELYYISCRDLTDGFNRLGINSIRFPISPEIKFSEKKDYPYHYPNQFEEIISKIKQMDCKGKVLIFGSGILKFYGKIWKDQGGIAVDMGSAMDLWSGLKTRGEGKGINVIDNTYKL